MWHSLLVTRREMGMVFAGMRVIEIFMYYGVSYCF